MAQKLTGSGTLLQRVRNIDVYCGLTCKRQPSGLRAPVGEGGVAALLLGQISVQLGPVSLYIPGRFSAGPSAVGKRATIRL